MKIGDKVRFLSETGGGIIAGFKGSNIVLVEDEDGFEIPTPVSEVVVVDTNDYNIAKVNTRDFDKGESENKTVRRQESVRQQQEEETERPVTFKAAPVERRGAEALNLKLAFVPADPQLVTAGEFHVYMINDSNYSVDYCLLTVENNSAKVLAKGSLDANTKADIKTVSYGSAELDALGKLIVQGFAFKENKAFLMKPVFQIQARIDKTKFYKEHAFKENDFFDEPALVYDLIVDDKPVREIQADAEELKKAMQKKIIADNTPRKKEDSPVHLKNGIMEVDLHIKSLLDSTDHMTNAEILAYQMDTFRKIMDENKKFTGRKIVFIHGKGDGVLRNSIVKELRHSYKTCQWQDASFREYGFGATLVVIK